jgi:hypothetical protein
VLHLNDTREAKINIWTQENFHTLGWNLKQLWEKIALQIIGHYTKPLLIMYTYIQNPTIPDQNIQRSATKFLLNDHSCIWVFVKTNISLEKFKQN